jgi:hypothetical protein
VPTATWEAADEQAIAVGRPASTLSRAETWFKRRSVQKYSDKDKLGKNHIFSRTSEEIFLF